MMQINTQIDALIRHLKIKKVDFAKRLKIDQSYVTRLIKGDNLPSDRLIDAICKEFNVNENWLRTGEGEMLKKLDREQEIAQMVSFLFKEESTSFKYRFTKAICNMNEAGWDALEKLVNDINKID